MPFYKAVIFDVDDTLTISYFIKRNHFKHVARTFFGRELTDADIRAQWGKPFDEFVRNIYHPRVTPAELQRTHFATTHLFPVALQPGAANVVRQLHAAGKHLGIVTSTGHAVMQDDASRLAFPFGLFMFAQTADDTAAHKPDPAVFAPALAKLNERGVRPAEAVYVGDSLHDFTAARGVGLNFIAVTTGLVSVEQFAAAGAPVITPSLYGCATLIA